MPAAVYPPTPAQQVFRLQPCSNCRAKGFVINADGFPLVCAACHPQRNLLTRRAAVAKDRRFTSQPLTGFGAL
jgi:hypothetical protein